jgi:uncharacterized protein YcbX
MTEAFLSRIYVYPIKSAGGVALDDAVVDPRGLKYDRRWMLVDGAGRYMTQRRFPRMALIKVGLSSEALVIGAPGMPALEVPLRQEPAGSIRAQIWEDVLRAALVGEGADRWFGEFLGVRCRLVYMPDDVIRPAWPRYAADEDRVGFADRFPFLLVSAASLDDLNSRLESPVAVDRFRPNLVVGGCEPYAEDGWERIRIGDVPFRVAKSCARCVITTVDQRTGIKGKEPLRTLSRYRRFDGQVFFGRNLIHDSQGILRAGDPLKIVSRLDDGAYETAVPDKQRGESGGDSRVG